MVDVRRISAGNKGDERKRTNWSRWLMAAVASAAISSAMPSCSSNEDPIPTIPPVGDGGVVTDGGVGDGGMDGGRCIPSTSPPCFGQSRTETMHEGEVFVEGDFQFRLNSTKEVDGEQVATIDILDSCGALIRSVDIRENETITRDVEGTNIRLEVRAESVTVTTPKSAKITATMTCTGTDGGTTDGGHGGDGGMGGMDAGTTDGGSGGDGGAGGDGGMGGDGGAMADGGVVDGGADGGSGGDGGMSVDGGSEGGADGGVMDGGGGMDGGISDGGMEGGADGGGMLDGGVSDAGDGGFIDGGTIPGSCSGTFQESRYGLWPKNVDVSTGGYSFRFTGQTMSGVTYQIRCTSGMALLGTVNVDESVPYVFNTSGSYRIFITNLMSSPVNSTSDISVAP